MSDENKASDLPEPIKVPPFEKPEWLEVIKVIPGNYDRLIEITGYTHQYFHRIYCEAANMKTTQVYGFADISKLENMLIQRFSNDDGVPDEYIDGAMLSQFFRAWSRAE